MSTKNTQTDWTFDAEVESLLDEALVAEELPADVIARIAVATRMEAVAVRERRDRPVLARIGAASTWIAGIAAAVLLMVGAGLWFVSWDLNRTHQPMTDVAVNDPATHDTPPEVTPRPEDATPPSPAVVRLSPTQVRTQLASLQALPVPPVEPIDRQIDDVSWQLAMVEDVDPWIAPAWDSWDASGFDGVWEF